MSLCLSENNVLPLYFLPKEELNRRWENHIKNNVIDEHGRINYSKFKYNLADLFSQTPVFEGPPLMFDEKESAASKWKQVSQLVLNPNK